jgi:hypothetical protein
MFCLGDDGPTFDAIAMFGIFVFIFAIELGLGVFTRGP